MIKDGDAPSSRIEGILITIYQAICPVLLSLHRHIHAAIAQINYQRVSFSGA
jgi:hypothetical protein